MATQNRADLIEQTWPYDGPHDADKVTDAAYAVSRLVRYMNNATQPGTADHSLPYGSTVDRVLGNVTAAVYGLEQLMGQLAGALEQNVDGSTLYDDRRDRPGSQTASELATRLRAVRDSALPQVANRLDAARELSHHLGGELGNDTRTTPLGTRTRKESANRDQDSPQQIPGRVHRLPPPVSPTGRRHP